ncbi:hypothetical protein B5F44_15265 [Gordonibacter urolithinfaciens]|uniref:helix-turn-helix domain-containing protein n=1 Tax=Gordonibacter urolithinfaciens TaxID=1335613 RepID=UPI000B393CF8|nr:helix-turn-helix domain-containing protein [Gordonibacter urolithinfaciens]OUO83626.1 hypothetical protein B5F44_15265 [Gordonibacter urolithinfaciens]
MEETERPAAGARPSGGGMGGESAPAWLGVSDVQRYLGISRPLVYRLIHEGTIPSIRLGRAIRVSRTALDRALESLDPHAN